MYRAALLAALLVLAGCQAPSAGPSAASPVNETTGTDAPEPTATPASADAADALPDPETDRLGWENGYWHNESLDVTNSDGLNESEREAVVARSMARVEWVREREFDETVPVSVIDRSTYQNRSTAAANATSARFDNGKFEALFLIGEDRDALEAQNAALSQSVLGYYSPVRDEIVIVADSETPQLDGEATLAHELVHALQDQQFDLTNGTVTTRDAYQGRNGLVEGDASLVERRYTANCGEIWSCLDSADSTQSGGGDSHFGLNFLQFFPYSDGPGFVEHRYEAGGWAAVDAAFADKPDGATEVIYPEQYPEWEPATVSLPDRSNDEWERVRPPGRADYAVVGQSAIAASLAYTVTDDYEDASVVAADDVLNFEGSEIDGNDPYNYDVPAARGWAGGKLSVYENGDRSGYVWRTRWTNESEAAEFADTWSAVVRHWGGEETGENVWTIGEDSPFTDAVRIDRSGATVTVVNAPDAATLEAVHDA
ncbi:Hvo_1808 family surface protein [Halomicrobium sp. IBSBa]|uniref:Hvo_1808 family surface protein n=1 Tax=Halomicrobium sp. IBSBa TaxID=2778916 RepID=UPI001ABFD25A|nr:Hvo_1808 family surface protein [Halomicrobium sp. IBSBa]MBO4247206.1 Hvo_1808 family surface protein [Halomicrobium sp. IBSBa]